MPAHCRSAFRNRNDPGTCHKNLGFRVVLEVTAADDRGLCLTADGFLVVDGRVIYQMTNFTLQ